MSFLRRTRRFKFGDLVKQEDGGNEDINVMWCRLCESGKEDVEFVLVVGLHPSPAGLQGPDHGRCTKLALNVYVSAVKDYHRIATGLDVSARAEQAAKIATIEYIKSILPNSSEEFFKRRQAIQYCPVDVLQLTFGAVENLCRFMGFEMTQDKQFDAGCRLAFGFVMETVVGFTERLGEIQEEIRKLSNRLEQRSETSAEPLSPTQEASFLANMIALARDLDDTIVDFFVMDARMLNPKSREDLLRTYLTVSAWCRLRRKGVDVSNFVMVPENDLSDSEKTEMLEDIMTMTTRALAHVFPDEEIKDTDVLTLIKCPVFCTFIGKHDLVNELTRMKEALPDASLSQLLALLKSPGFLPWVNGFRDRTLADELTAIKEALPDASFLQLLALLNSSGFLPWVNRLRDRTLADELTKIKEALPDASFLQLLALLKSRKGSFFFPH
jgi:hypothetical protein